MICPRCSKPIAEHGIRPPRTREMQSVPKDNLLFGQELISLPKKLGPYQPTGKVGFVDGVLHPNQPTGKSKES